MSTGRIPLLSALGVSTSSGLWAGAVLCIWCGGWQHADFQAGAAKARAEREPSLRQWLYTHNGMTRWRPGSPSDMRPLRRTRHAAALPLALAVESHLGHLVFNVSSAAGAYRPPTQLVRPVIQRHAVWPLASATHRNVQQRAPCGRPRDGPRVPDRHENWCCVRVTRRLHGPSEAATCMPTIRVGLLPTRRSGCAAARRRVPGTDTAQPCAAFPRNCVTCKGSNPALPVLRPFLCATCRFRSKSFPCLSPCSCLWPYPWCTPLLTPLRWDTQSS